MQDNWIGRSGYRQRYRLLSVWGQAGDVFQPWMPLLGKQVALKPPDIGSGRGSEKAL